MLAISTFRHNLLFSNSALGGLDAALIITTRGAVLGTRDVPKFSRLAISACAISGVAMEEFPP
jgi:hypothetical protein